MHALSIRILTILAIGAVAATAVIGLGTAGADDRLENRTLHGLEPSPISTAPSTSTPPPTSTAAPTIATTTSVEAESGDRFDAEMQKAKDQYAAGVPIDDIIDSFDVSVFEDRTHEPVAPVPDGQMTLVAIDGSTRTMPRAEFEAESEHLRQTTPVAPGESFGIGLLPDGTIGIVTWCQEGDPPTLEEVAALVQAGVDLWLAQLTPNICESAVIAAARDAQADG